MWANEITILSVCFSVSVPQSTFEPIGRFYENEQGGHAIEGDVDAKILMP
jgi:hypothetical protein